jgi:lipid II:glycine glycyltransferase (peptidoglycan interpeptide bridge formation enzyme)
MAEYLASSGAAVVSLGLSLGITDALPFYWRGWKVVPHYTYRTDLDQGEDRILAGMSTERRKNLRKSAVDGISVAEETDMKPMRVLIEQTFARQSKAFSLASADLIFSAFPPGEQSYCMVASADGRPMAGVYVVHDGRTAYYLMGGYAEGAHHGAGALAMWHAILKAKELGLEVFDFEGSVIPPIERYFRGFGGQLTPILSVHKAWLPLEMALKFYRRQWF